MREISSSVSSVHALTKVLSQIWATFFTSPPGRGVRRALPPGVFSYQDILPLGPVTYTE